MEHRDLEMQLCSLKEKEDALLFPSGFAANQVSPYAGLCDTLYDSSFSFYTELTNLRASMHYERGMSVYVAGSYKLLLATLRLSDSWGGVAGSNGSSGSRA